MFHLTRQDLQRSRSYQEVVAEGRAEGEAALLLRMLERKFGPLPDEARRRLADADAETLLAWGERLLDAGNLDKVWGG